MQGCATRFNFLALVILLAAGPSMIAYADTADGAATTEPSSEPQGLDEIVVTARKRSESLQITPIAVTAISAANLEARGAANISSLGEVVPNVTFSPTASNSGSANAAVIFIRGIGQSDFYPQVDPGVGVYLDGVYIARTTGAVLDLVDVDQIEVLRGPQGTLYGKNTIGGALNIHSKAPADTLGGYAEVTGGSFDRGDAKFRVDVPINDDVHTALNFASLNRDGYISLLGLNGQPTGVKLGDVSALTGRFALNDRVNDRLDIDFSADWTRRRERSSGSTLLSINPDGIAPYVNNNFTAPMLVPTLGGRAYYNNQYITGNPYASFGNPLISKSNLDVLGAALTPHWKVTDDIDIKSITAYRKSKSDNDFDGDDSPLIILQPATLIDQKQFSQEVNVSGKSFGDSLDWIAGAYYLKEKIYFNAPVDIAFVSTSNSAQLENSSEAGFGQGSYHITDRLSFTGGLRYTRDEKSSDARVIATRLIDPGSLTVVPTPIPLLIDSESRVFKKLTPAATIDYRFTPDVFGYASFSQGFKSGGFSERIAYPRAKSPSFGPENVTSYELGLKVSAFDNHVRLNSAVFQTNYSDLQVTVFNMVEPLTENGGKAQIRGFESELTALPVTNLNISASLGYLDGKYLSINPGTLIPDGAKLAYTPAWTLTTSVSYKNEFNFGSITPRLDWSYRSATYFDAINTPELRQAGYGLLNASVRYETVSGRLAVTAGATNLNDKRYILGGFADFAASGFATATYARPREWYLTVHQSF